MSELDELLKDSSEKKQERMEKAKKDLHTKLDDKRGRPMGYIFPSRIKDAVMGETPITVYQSTSKSEKHEIGEEWEGPDGKIHVQHDGWIETKSKNSDALRELRKLTETPFICPTCKEPMKARIDKKFYLLRGKCHKCVAEDETKMRIQGTYTDYEKIIVLRNKIAFYMDSKNEIEEFLKNLKNYQEFVNHDGTIEKWTATDEEQTRNFLTNELKNLDELMSECIKEFEELEKKFNNEEVLLNDESSTPN